MSKHTIHFCAEYNLTKGCAKNPELAMTLAAERAGDYQEGQTLTLNDVVYSLHSRAVDEAQNVVRYKLEEKRQ